MRKLLLFGLCTAFSALYGCSAPVAEPTGISNRQALEQIDKDAAIVLEVEGMT